MLHDIENGAPWPTQLQVGLVNALHKRNGCENVQGFRPICVFSVVYRCWAGIRARQILQRLRDFSPEGALGFMPHHEASEAWFLIEGLVERALQADQPLAGYGTDLVRAFNNLPRAPLFAAGFLGLPNNILDPWRAFVHGMQRRFVVQGAISEPVLSSCGFAEGCPLSTVAMSVCSFLYHEYMRAFAPSVESLSYVDNLLGIGKGAFDVAIGLNTTRCLCEALALKLDESKTYAWATTAGQRRILREMHVPVLESCVELGGTLSFGPATRNRPLVQKCKSLPPLFAALQRSKASWHVKLSALPIKFWSFALHGISACPISDSLLQSLRTQAVRALKSAPAGASPALRLSLCSPPTADPGFYQCWNCLTTARRLCSKQPRLLVLWTDFMQRFDGRLLHGPFSKLVAVLGGIGWRVGRPPMIIDEEDLSHDLLLIPLPALRRLAERAWLNSLACAHAHRPSMAGLNGLDPGLARLDQQHLSPTEAARVAALQSGALMFGEAQAKFDLTQSGLCSHCQLPDNKEHRPPVCSCSRGPGSCHCEMGCAPSLSQTAFAPACQPGC